MANGIIGIGTDGHCALPLPVEEMGEVARLEAPVGIAMLAAAKRETDAVAFVVTGADDIHAFSIPRGVRESDVQRMAVAHGLACAHGADIHRRRQRDERGRFVRESGASALRGFARRLRDGYSETIRREREMAEMHDQARMEKQSEFAAQAAHDAWDDRLEGSREFIDDVA